MAARSAESVRRTPSRTTWRTASSQAARLKMKTMAGSISRRPSSSTISVRRGARKGRRGPLPLPLPVGRPASLQRPAHRLVDAEPFAARLSVVLQERAEQGLVVLPSVDGEVVAQDDGALPLDDDRRVPADRAQPAAELVGVVHGGGEADEANLGRAQDEDLLPDPAPVGVLNEVDLVEHHRVQALEEIGAGQQHVAQHLGGHDDDRRPGAQGGVAGEQPDVLLPVGRRPAPRTSGSRAP